jgi:phage repressor protein C with HTH and peptisase S24 domain
MTEFILIGFVVVLMISLSFIHKLYSKIEKLEKKISNLKSKLKDSEELVSIEPGDKAIVPDYGLTNTETKENFHVTYEVEVLEVSVDKVKVNAVDYTSTDGYARDPQNKHSIINFLQNKWVDRGDIELIIDDSMRRDRKLHQILN